MPTANNIRGAAALASALILVSGGASGCTKSAVREAHVAGSVIASPSCPAQLPESPCPPLLVEGAVVELRQGESVAADGLTDARGAFRLSAAPGAYAVHATITNGGFRSETSRPVELVAGRTVNVSLSLDTGIR